MSIGRKAACFLFLTFAVGWTAIIVGRLWHVGSTPNSGLSLLIFAASPGIAAVVCSLAFEKGWWLQTLGTAFRPNWWWLWALMIPVALILLGIGVAALIAPGTVASLNGVALILMADIVGWAILKLSIRLAFFEELGWRGYLYHLWRPFGFWRASLGIGLAWGVWHWPLLYLSGIGRGGHSVVGLVIPAILALMFAPLLTLVRDRSDSVWAAGICHGAYDAFPVLTAAAFGIAQSSATSRDLSAIVALVLAPPLVALIRRKNARAEP